MARRRPELDERFRRSKLHRYLLADENVIVAQRQHWASVAVPVGSAVAGLVAITPAAGFVTPMGAIGIGLSVSLICYISVTFLKPRFARPSDAEYFCKKRFARATTSERRSRSGGILTVTSLKRKYKS